MMQIFATLGRPRPRGRLNLQSRCKAIEIEDIEARVAELERIAASNQTR